MINVETSSRLIILSEIFLSQQRPLCEKKHLYLSECIPVDRKIPQNLRVDPKSSFQERSLKGFLSLSIMQNDNSIDVALEGGPLTFKIEENYLQFQNSTIFYKFTKFSKLLSFRGALGV